MSIVNRMLRDLDRREAGDEHTVYTQQLHASGTRTGRPMSRSIIGIATVVLLATGFGAWHYFPAHDAPPATAPVVATASPAPDPDATQTAVPTDTPPTQTDEAPDTSGHAPATDPATDPAPARDHAIAAPPPAETAVVPQASAPARTASKPDAGTRTAAPAVTTPAQVSKDAAPSGTSTPPARRETEPGDTTPARIDVRPHAPVARTAEQAFRQAASLIAQGRHEEARAALRTALEMDPAHEGARQTLAVLLVEAQQAEDAMALLAEGLRRNPAQTNFAIVLARLRLDQGDNAGALQVLREHGNAATQNAEYRAFTAALLQRTGHAEEAIAEYRAALALAPKTGIWWVGLGISHEAAGQAREAADAYRNAQALGGLPPAMSELVQRKLQTLR